MVSEDSKRILEKDVTVKSTPDYISFDMYDGVRLAVLLLETKAQRSFQMKSIAQAIRYFRRAHSVIAC